MAFLDDLKKEAEARKQQEQIETQSKLASVSQSFLAVQAKYKEVQRYLQELVNQINALDLNLTRSYFLEGVGQVDDYRPREYALSLDSIRIGQKDFINTLTLRFRCVTPRALTFERNNPSQIESAKEFFWQNNVKYQCTEYRNDRGIVTRAVFNVSSEIPVTIKFSADFETARISLHVKNFSGLTVNEFAYDLDEVNGPFLDEFAKFLLAKPSKFRELGRHQQAMRELTRARQVKDIQYAGTHAESEDDIGSKTGIFNRLKSILS